MILHFNLRASFWILAAILNSAVADPTDHQEKLQTLSERIKASLTDPELLHDLPAHVPKSVLKAQRKEGLLRSTGKIEAHPGTGPSAGSGTDTASGTAHAPQDFSDSDISRFTCESLELIHQKCNLPTDIANAFSGVKDLAQNALSKKGPKNNAAHPFEQLMRSITQCSSPKANQFDPYEVSDHLIADYLAKISKQVSKTQKSSLQSSSSSNTNNQESMQFQPGRILNKAPNPRILKGALPEWSTHVPPTETQVQKSAGDKSYGAHLIGSLPFSSDEFESLPQFPEVPDFTQTKKGAKAKAQKNKKSSLMDNLKNNPVSDWLKNLLSSIGLFFNGLKTKAKNHAITIHHKFVAEKPAAAENSRPRRAGNFFDMDGVNLAQMLGKPFKNLLVNFQSKSDGGGGDSEGVKTIKRFLNAALRIYKHTCSPTRANVELFKSVATQTLSSLSNNGQVMFALNTFVDKSVVKAIDECER